MARNEEGFEYIRYARLRVECESGIARIAFVSSVVGPMIELVKNLLFNDVFMREYSESV